VIPFDVEDPPQLLEEGLSTADVLVHLAGVNRPLEVSEYDTGNAGFTSELTGRLRRKGRAPAVVFASSTQAALDNAYGRSKLAAEQVLQQFAADGGASVSIFRLPNVFGKWCRPNYNSAVATFCHNIARDLPITVSDPRRELELVHVDDVVRAFLDALRCMSWAPGVLFRSVQPVYRSTLQNLVDTLCSFRESRRTLRLPDFSDRFTRCLYGMYVSYLPPDGLDYGLTSRSDARGMLTELLKSPCFGQIFVSTTRRVSPAATTSSYQGGEVFVLQGEAIVRSEACWVGKSLNTGSPAVKAAWSTSSRLYAQHRKRRRHGVAGSVLGG